jgi:fibronectin-binding autotransporter adhesin
VSTLAIIGTAGVLSENLTINTAAGGAVAINGVVGPDITAITVFNSGGTTFWSTVDAASVTLTLSSAAITFTDALTLSGSLSTAALVAYNVNFNNAAGGQASSIGGSATLWTTGTVSTGNAVGDSLACTAGFFHTTGPTTANGTVSTGGGAGQNISLAALTIGAGDLTLNAGANGVISVSGNTAGAGNDLTITNCLSATFTGAVNNVALFTTVAQPYSVAFNGGGTITSAVTFNNTGTLTIGDDALDVFNFSNTVTATTQLSKSIAGTINTTNDNVDFGTTSTSVTANATINPGSGDITLDGVSIAAGALLTLGNNGASVITTSTIAGVAASGSVAFNTTDTVTVSGVVGPNIGTVTVTNSGGTTFQAGVTATAVTLTATTGAITFTGALSLAGALDALGGGFNINFNNGAGGQVSSVGGAATLLNTGDVSFGNNAADSFSAAGGTTHAAGPSTLIGSIGTTNNPVNLGNATVTGACSVSTGTGAITLGNVVINDGFTLTLGTGVATAISVGSINGQATPGASNLTVNTTATMTVGGAIDTDFGTLTINNGGTVDVGGNNFTIDTLVNNGVFQLAGTQGTQTITVPDTNSGIVTYNGGAGGTILLSSFYNLRINGAGAFTLGQPIFVGDPASGGQVQISAGTLDVGAASHQITVYGDWDNAVGAAGFTCRQGSVVFLRPAPGTININGDNNWFIFDCQVPGITILFEVGKTQTMVNVVGAIFRVKGTVGNWITLDSSDSNPYWNFTVNFYAMVDMEYVDVYRSNATIPIMKPANVNITDCPGWLLVMFVQSRQTEDWDPVDGKIDRIRVVLPASINDNFGDLVVNVTGYSLSYTGPGGLPYDGSDGALALNEFWILLQEKPYLDTGVTPAWTLTNSLLRDQATNTYIVLIQVPPEIPNDAAPPRIGYTLAVAGRDRLFVHFSEPVTALAASDFEYPFGTDALAIISQPTPQREYELQLAAPVAADDEIKSANMRVTSGPLDPAGNPLVSATHRVSDVGLGLSTDVVMEPVWAGDGIFTILGTFDGTRWLRDVDIDLQAWVEDDAFVPPDPVTKLWFDVNVPAANTSSSGFWLPPYDETTYNGIVPWEVSPFPRLALDGTWVTSNQRNFTIPSSDPEVVDAATLEFVLQIVNNGGTIPTDLYCARVDDPLLDANWYRNVEPWSFDIHEERTQKGGVTILKNVINPDLGEITTLHYALAKPGTVTISVFDLAGDLVRVLMRGSVSAGDHLQTWDGKNSVGKIVARGVYFIKIVGPGIDEVRKVLVIR